MGNQNNNIKENKINKKRKYVWVDPAIEREPNVYYYKKLFLEKEIDCKKYDNIDDAFNFLIERKNIFKEILIIISGKLFNSFYQKIKNNMELIKFSPTIIVFTSQEKEHLFINQLKMNNIYYDNDLFDKRYIYTSFSQIKDFINDNIQEESDLSFDIIDNLDQLIIPNYYCYLIEDANNYDITNFNIFLKGKFLPPSSKKEKYSKLNILKNGNRNVQELINQIEYKKLPKNIIIKYWLRIYTMQSEFFNELNKSLRSKGKDICLYYPLIKLCYEGIRKRYFKSYDKEIYRCSKIHKEEFKIIQKKFNLKNKNNIEIPKIIIFSRSFLSFTNDIDNAKRFIEFEENTYSILYILEKFDNNNEEDIEIIPNALIEDLSALKEEKEVLVFPFSCFEIVDIKETNFGKINYIIRLKYLSNYSKSMKEKFGNNFFDKVQSSNFSQELLSSGILKIQNSFTFWEKLEESRIELDKICFLLDNKGDCLSFLNSEIMVINIYLTTIKQKINIHKDKILDISKFTFNRICSCSKDNTIKIIQLTENNTNFKNLYNIDLNQKYAVQIKFLYNEDIIFLDNMNNITFYTLKEKEYIYDKQIKEENTVITKMKLSPGKIIYMTENNEGKKMINFINSKNKIKEEDNIKIIEEKKQKLKVIDLLIFHEYIVVGYDYRIDFIYYQKKPFIVRSLKFFDFEITHLIILSNDRIILGLYDSEQNEAIIRENLLNIEDLKNKTDKFDCVGEGKLESKKIENIVKIKESQILINIKNSSFIIYERKNEISEKLKESLNRINEVDNIGYQKTRTLTKISLDIDEDKFE